MRLILGGLRGSWPIARADCVRYGGETTSFLVEGAGDSCVVVDLGTGVRSLGERLRECGATSIVVLMTHYHLDHITGLPSFAPVYNPSCRIEFAAPERAGRTVDRVLPALLEDPYWPLQMRDLHAVIRFTTLDGESSDAPVRRGDFEIRWVPVNHPAGCTAYRIDEPSTGASVVIATDVEWATAPETLRTRFLSLCREPSPASVLIFDGHFTPEEYPTYAGWGHSTWLEAVEVARAAGVKKLVVTHHSQFHVDEDLARIDTELQAAAPWASIGVQDAHIEVMP